MVQKRPAGVVDLSSSDDSENDDLEDVQCSQLPYMDYDSYQSASETQVVSDVSVLFVTQFFLYFFVVVIFCW